MIHKLTQQHFEEEMMCGLNNSQNLYLVSHLQNSAFSKQGKRDKSKLEQTKKGPRSQDLFVTSRRLKKSLLKQKLNVDS